MTPHRGTGRPRATARDGEHGFVIVWYAIVLSLLLAVAAFAVDVLHGYSVVQAVHNTADAAATAGVVHRVGRPDLTGATARAREVAADNFESDVSVDDDGLLPNQLRVEVTTEIDTFFAPIIGVRDLTVTRSSVAEYDPPVMMGSPANRFGNDPQQPGLTDQGRFWAQISGPLTAKASGNAFMSRWCDDRTRGATMLGNYAGSRRTDNCDDGTTHNDDHTGVQYFVVDADTSPRVEIFDPVFVDVNQNCLKTEFQDFVAAHPSPDPRLAVGPGLVCTGDFDTRWNDADGPSIPPPGGDQVAYDDEVQARDRAVETTFTLYAPDDTPFNHTDNDEVVCSETYEGYADIRFLWDADPGLTGWREWVTFCNANRGSGKYVLAVRTGDDQQGNNHYSLRVTNAAVSAVDYMSVFTNESDATGEFFLARVLPSSVERTLHLAFFDVGDNTSGGSNSLQILPPADASIGEFTGCAATAPAEEDGPWDTPWEPGARPWGSLDTARMSSGCRLDGVKTDTDPTRDYNGQWVTVTVPIPKTYTCDHADPAGCWLKIRFDNATSVHDTSTWTAHFAGNPVRIIE